AVLQAARAHGLSAPPIREADYRVGYGLTVSLEASTVRVGSMRFMEMEGIAVPPAVAGILARCHDESHSLVVVAVDDTVVGAIDRKRPHGAVSRRGASTLATDTAEVILLDESLNQLGRLLDVARECRTNTTVTIASVLVPSVLCVGGVLLGTFTFAHARLLNI